ncbi:hypothetical protein HDE_06050 [Halotydeus destructor]|nr:hypothetical protein HDE_06050 [Halotydeus destructor]
MAKCFLVLAAILVSCPASFGLRSPRGVVDMTENGTPSPPMVMEQAVGDLTSTAGGLSGNVTAMDSSNSTFMDSSNSTKEEAGTDGMSFNATNVVERLLAFGHSLPTLPPFPAIPTLATVRPLPAMTLPQLPQLNLNRIVRSPGHQAMSSLPLPAPTMNVSRVNNDEAVDHDEDSDDDDHIFESAGSETLNIEKRALVEVGNQSAIVPILNSNQSPAVIVNVIVARDSNATEPMPTGNGTKPAHHNAAHPIANASRPVAHVARPVAHVYRPIGPVPVAHRPHHVVRPVQPYVAPHPQRHYAQHPARKPEPYVQPIGYHGHW